MGSAPIYIKKDPEIGRGPGSPSYRPYAANLMFSLCPLAATWRSSDSQLFFPMAITYRVWVQKQMAYKSSAGFLCTTYQSWAMCCQFYVWSVCGPDLGRVELA